MAMSVGATSPNAQPAPAPTTSPTRGANRRSLDVFQTLSATIVPKVSAATAGAAGVRPPPAGGVTISFRAAWPNASPIKSTARPAISTVKILRNLPINPLNSSWASASTKIMP